MEKGTGQEALENPAPAPPQQALAVLHVEDSEDDGLLIQRELGRAGYALRYERVETAAAMREALARAGWDVVISDHDMPRFSAPEALRVLGESGQELPFIVVTGALGEEFAAALMKGGAHDFVKKSHLARLVPAVERELRDAATRRARKEAEAQLRTNEERFRALVENAFEAMTIWNRSGEATYVSPANRALFGASPHVVLGRRFRDFVHPDDIATCDAWWARVLARPDQYVPVSTRVRHRDGSYRWIEATGRNLLDNPSVGGVVTNARDVTERRHAEEALRESQERLQLAVESSNLGLWDCDLRTGRSQYSASWHHQFGYEDREMSGSLAEWSELVHPDDRERVEALVDEHLRAGGSPKAPYEIEFRIRHKDGTYRWVLSRGRVLRDDRGRPVRMLGGHIDVTARRQAEGVMAGEKRVLELLASDTPLAGVLDELCRVFESLVPGLLCSVLLLDDDGKHLRHGAAPSLPESYTRAVDGVAIGPGVGSCGTAAHECRTVVVADIATDPLWADFRALALAHDLRACWSMPVMTSDGAVLGTFAMYYRQPHEPSPAELAIGYRAGNLARTAIEHRRAQQTLQQQAARLEVLRQIDQAILTAGTTVEVANAVLTHVARIIPSCRAAVYVLPEEERPDESGILLAVQGRGSEATPPGRATPRTPLIDAIIAQLRQGRVYVIDDVTTLVPAVLGDTLQAVDVQSGLCVPLLADGDLVGALNLWADQPGAFTATHVELAREVAAPLAIAIRQAQLRAEIERHAATLEGRVRERTAQLEASNRELESFSYSVSHDLRAPLRVIDGFTRALLDDYAAALDATGQDFLRRVRAGTVRMRHLIDDLIDLSRVTRSEMGAQCVDLSALARAVAADLQKNEPARRAHVVVAPDVVAQGDPQLLRVVLENLLGNAWKYTSRHATAEIEFGCLAAPHGNGSPAIDSPVFFVRDDGAGFDPRRADKLFGPFQRLHGADEFEGTGIGLATVQRIVHRHGGRVWAESAPEQGTTLYFTLGSPDHAVT